MTHHSADSSYEKSAHLYDLFGQKEDVEFYCHFAFPPSNVLDVGAGTGRLAIPLAERGSTVCCVEPSPAMRRELERKLLQRPRLAHTVTVVPGEAASFEVSRRFPVAILSGTFDHFLDDGERLASLKNIGRHLAAGGALVFDATVGMMQDAPLSPAGEVEVGDRTVRRLVGGKALPGGKREVVLVFEVYRGTEMIERIEERGLIGQTSQRGIHRILSEAGFEVRQEWSDFQRNPYREGARLLIVEAVKRNE